MPAVCCYFQVHQPVRLRNYSFFDIGDGHDYEDTEQNKALLMKVTRKCYLPAGESMLKTIRECGGDFRIAFSISGVLLDQMDLFCPEAADMFKRLADTGCVEFLAETYHHSLAFLYSELEFEEQVRAHTKRIKSTFGQEPVTFRNTELIYNNEVAAAAKKMGFKVVLAEGADSILGSRSPGFVYVPAGCSDIRLLLKNYRLSDDVAFRFSSSEWEEYPLDADKFTGWIHDAGRDTDVVNIFMDYETIGEHQWAESGIFDFFETFPGKVLKENDFRFLTPCQVADECKPSGTLDVTDFVSWADTERDLSAWIGNELQESSLELLYGLEDEVRAAKDPHLLETWRRLQTSDHFYYMCTKWFDDGDVHKYFNPYLSPYDAYINYMNVLTDFTEELR